MKLGIWASASGGAPLSAGSGIALAHVNSPFMSAWAWTPGFGAKFTNPAVLPPAAATGVSFSPGETDITIGNGGTSPFIAAWIWSALGFGVKHANPAAISASTVAVTFRDAIGATFWNFANAVGVSPFIQIYNFSKTGAGFGARYGAPATAATGTGQVPAFNSGQSVIALAHNTAPGISAWPFATVGGYGAKFANPATPMGGNGSGVDFTIPDNVIIVGHTGTPFVAAYLWDNGAGFGTKLANPGVLPSGQVRKLSISPNNAQVALPEAGGTNMGVYDWAGGGFGSRYVGPIPNSGALVGHSAAWTPNSATVFRGSNLTSPDNLNGWPFVAGFGAVYAPPAVAAVGTANAIAVAS